MKEEIRLEKERKMKGIISIVLSAVGFAGMSFFVKLSGDVPTMQKAMFRNCVAALIAFVMMRQQGLRYSVPKELRIPLLLRCCFGTLGILCNFWAIMYLKLGDASILQKMAPFFAIIMSIFILGEKPNKMSIFSVLLALLGAAFVVKPGQGILGLPALVALLGGFSAGTAYTYVRKVGLGGVKGPVVVFSFSMFSVLVLLPFFLLQYKPMTAEQTIFLILAGCSAAVGQIFVTKAYAYAPAKEISVFDYSQVLFAAVLGFVVFGEIPDLYSVIGYAIIFGTALWKWKQTGSENASPLEKRVADMRTGKNIHEHELLEEEE